MLKGINMDKLWSVLIAVIIGIILFSCIIMLRPRTWVKLDFKYKSNGLEIHNPWDCSIAKIEVRALLGEESTLWVESRDYSFKSGETKFLGFVTLGLPPEAYIEVWGVIG